MAERPFPYKEVMLRYEQASMKDLVGDELAEKYKRKTEIMGVLLLCREFFIARFHTRIDFATNTPIHEDGLTAAEAFANFVRENKIPETILDKLDESDGGERESDMMILRTFVSEQYSQAA